MKTPIDNIIRIGEKVIDKVVPDAEQRWKYKQTLADMEATELENSFKNIQLEITSEDKYVKRARPTFLYIVYLFFILCIPFSFAFINRPESGQAILDLMKLYLNSLPPELWTTFTIGYLGYSGLRTYEKYKSANV